MAGSDRPNHCCKKKMRSMSARGRCPPTAVGLGFGVVHLDQRFNGLPRHNAIHFFQKHLLSRALGFDGVAAVGFGKADLFHAPDHPTAWASDEEVVQGFSQVFYKIPHSFVIASFGYHSNLFVLFLKTTIHLWQ